MMKIGYARVSTQGQDLALQLDVLTNIGCEKIYQEKRTGISKDCPQRHAEVLVIWKLDRWHDL